MSVKIWKCSNCGKVNESGGGFFGTNDLIRYKCIEHKSLCINCVELKFFGQSKCKTCGLSVERYMWNGKGWDLD